MLKRFVIVATLALVGVVIMFGTVPPAHAVTVTVDLYAVADAEITGNVTGSYANTTNWGGLTNLIGNVAQAGGPTSAQFPTTGDGRGLFKFDLSSIPSGATIDSATVSLYVWWDSATGTRITSIPLYQVTSGWTELGVTYDTRPTWNTTAATSMGIPSPRPYNGYINGSGASLKSLVQGWLDGDIVNYGLVTSDLRHPDYGLRIYAHEANGTSTDPKLTVTYTFTPVPIPPSALLFGTGLLGLVGVGGRRLFKK